MEGLFQPRHLLLILILFAACVASFWPIQRIVHRAGLNRAWSILVLVPFVNWVGIWVFTYTLWPILKNRSLGGGGPQP
jgi:predicted PurR-regulated permease PerM